MPQNPISRTDQLTNGPTDYPIEYTTGHVTFFGREFIVTPDVLIPRLETESLVRRARQLLRQIQSEGSRTNDTDRELQTCEMIGIAHLPRGEDSPDSVANQGGTVFGKTLKKDLWYAHSGRAIPYDPTLIKYARENRKSGNPVENRFWYDILRSDQLRPYRFTRQKPLLSYIVDFYSSDLGIVIELDGESHVDSIDYDQDRTDELEKYGLQVIRYTNSDIMMRAEGVVHELAVIFEARDRDRHITPLPPLEGGLSNIPESTETEVLWLRSSHLEGGLSNIPESTETEVLGLRSSHLEWGLSSIPGGQTSTIPPLHASNITELRTENSEPRTIVIDIGCGSGIIGTSVADLADEVVFLDISPAALEIAEKNFRTHFPEKKAQFIISDLLSNIPRFQNSNILYLTNLPYIKHDDWGHMSADTYHEPHLALFGGEVTGFELYERLFEQFSHIAPLIRGGGGFAQWRCLFEFGFDQRDIAETVLEKYPQWEYSFFADYAGVERFGEILFRKI